MDNWQLLLTLLNHGEYISGEELGVRLGVSRAAVWKQIKRLRDEGVPVEACQRRGYRFANGFSLLDAHKIEGGLEAAAAACLGGLDIRLTIPSTSDEVLARSKLGNADGYVCLAARQTAGKGRRGRAWVSPFAGNIYLSTVRRFEGGVAAVEGLSLAVGVVLVRALESLGYQDIRLKWPNDILWRERKLGGVLLEIVGDPAGLCDVIVGVGINVNMPSASAAQIDQPWVDLRQLDASPVDRNLVSAALLNGILPLLAAYEREGFAKYQDDWQALDAYREQVVVLRAGQQLFTGRSCGVSAGGALLIEMPEGLRSFSGGEISVRKTNDS